MARITVDDCLKRIPNRFQLTLAATTRAPTQRRLSRWSQPNRDKSTVIALREIATGKVGTEDTEEESEPAPQRACKRMGSI